MAESTLASIRISNTTGNEAHPSIGGCAKPETILDQWKNTSQSYATTTPMMHFDFVFFAVILPLILAAGFSGNIISIIVLKTSNKFKSVTPYLIPLAILDNIFIVLNGFGLCVVYGFKGILDLRAYCGSYLPYHMIYVVPIMLGTMSAGALVTAAMTITRYIHISWPMTAKVRLTKSVNRRIVLAIVVSSYGYNIYTMFADTFVSCFDANGEYLFQVILDRTSEAWIQADTILTITQSMLAVFLPWIVVALVNTLLVLKIRKENRKRAEIAESARQTDSVRLTTLLVCITASFLLLMFPMMANIVIIKATDGTYDVSLCKSTNQIGEVRRAMLFGAFTVLNSCVNFFWFLTLGSGFKAQVQQLMCGCRKR